MACFTSASVNVFNSLDHFELSLGEFCDLIQTDEADATILAADTTAWCRDGTDTSKTLRPHVGWCPTPCDTSIDRSKVRKQAGGNNSSSSLLSDSDASVFNKSERTTNTQANWPISVNNAVPLGQSCTRLPDLQTRHSDAATLACEGSPHQSGSATLVSAASHQHLPPTCQLNAGLHPVLHHTSSLTLDEDEFDAISRPPATHSSVEKQRRDRLNSLIEKLSTIVPPTDERYVAANQGSRRPKHVVLSDAIRTLRTLQEHVSTFPGCARTVAPSPTSITQQPVSGCQPSGPMDMPLPLDISNSATGVMVDAKPGAAIWRLRVTCRDRPGLLADVAVSIRNLPVSITAASVTTTPEGKAQQVFDLAVLDLSLAPEEVQCAVNAALYAHLLSAPSLPSPKGSPTEQLNNNLAPAAKRPRVGA